MSGSAAVGAADTVLVTGGAGFIGCNLADALAREGHHVRIYDSLARSGVADNLDWLMRRHPERISVTIADIRDRNSVADAVERCCAVFHLAAQVAVTTSLVSPMEDLEVNLLGTSAVLEAARARGGALPIIFASTNKVYGGLRELPLTLGREGYGPTDPDLAGRGLDEGWPLEFHTPYGCSKGAADQYVLDYARSYGLPTVVLRMSCIYGPRQRGTEDQGWVAHFVRRALADQPITIYGDGEQVRDIMHVRDAVDAYISAWRQIDALQGQAFNLGGGVENAVSLNTLLRYIGDRLDRELAVYYADWRQNDQRYFVSDTRKLRQALAIPPVIAWRDGVVDLLRFMSDARAETAVLPA